jgi:hypothetical protein
MPSTAPITGSTPGMIRTFLIDHERLILIVIVAVGLWFGYGKYAQIRLDHDNAVLQQAKVVADAQAQANAQLATQVAADKAALQALTDKVTAQNQQLTNANVALATALSRQQKTDATLPVPDLVNRWAQLAPGTNFAGAIGSGNNVTVTPANALATVQQLEKVPTLTQELANTSQQKANDEALLATQSKNIFDLSGQVVGLNKQIVDNDKVCQDQIKVVKAEAAKSKRRWFVVGYIAGFATKLFMSSKGL